MPASRRGTKRRIEDSSGDESVYVANKRFRAAKRRAVATPVTTPTNIAAVAVDLCGDEDIVAILETANNMVDNEDGRSDASSNDDGCDIDIKQTMPQRCEQLRIWNSDDGHKLKYLPEAVQSVYWAARMMGMLMPARVLDGGQIQKLPNELWREHIMVCLSVRDLAAFASTCRYGLSLLSGLPCWSSWTVAWLTSKTLLPFGELDDRSISGMQDIRLCAIRADSYYVDPDLSRVHAAIVGNMLPRNVWAKINAMRTQFGVCRHFATKQLNKLATEGKDSDDIKNQASDVVADLLAGGLSVLQISTLAVLCGPKGTELSIKMQMNMRGLGLQMVNANGYAMASQMCTPLAVAHIADLDGFSISVTVSRRRPADLHANTFFVAPRRMHADACAMLNTLSACTSGQRALCRDALLDPVDFDDSDYPITSLEEIRAHASSARDAAKLHYRQTKGDLIWILIPTHRTLVQLTRCLHKQRISGGGDIELHYQTDPLIAEIRWQPMRSFKSSRTPRTTSNTVCPDVCHYYTVEAVPFYESLVHLYKLPYGNIHH